MTPLPAPAVQPPGVHHLKIGDAVVTVLNDGMFDASSGWMTNIQPEDAEALLTATFRPLPPRITVSAFLISMSGKRILVDAGCGGLMGPTMGGVLRGLAAMGVDPGSIGAVLLTHVHPDHAGGLHDATGKSAFPNAELLVAESEIAFWTDDAVMGAAPEDAKPHFLGARAALAAYKGRTTPIVDGEILPGITAAPAYGHTPGHTGFLLASGADSLLIWGDIVHVPGVQFARPDVGMGFDVDGAAAIATRHRFLDMVAADRLRIAGMHLDFPTFGHVVRDGKGYAHIPEVWAPFV